MRKPKVLIVEHDEDWGDTFVYELEREDIEVEIVDDPNKITRQFEKTRFDVILVDVMWPRDDDADDEDKERLGEVINIVNATDSRIPIVALSRWDEAQNVALRYSNDIYDIWAKVGGYNSFLPYRIRNLIKQRQNEKGELVLVERVFELLENDVDLWEGDTLREFCNEYFRISGLGPLLNLVVKLFRDIGYHIGIGEDFLRDTYDNFAISEPLDVAMATDQWSHLRHSLSVFLSGYILLNKMGTQVQESLREESGFQSLNDVFSSWFIAASCHDICIFDEHMPSLMKKLVKLNVSRDVLIQAKAKHAKSGKMQSLLIQTLENFETLVSVDHQQVFEAMLDSLGNRDFSNVFSKPKLMEYIKNGIDHGVLSAMHVYKHLGSMEVESRVVSSACVAILIHNCLQEIFEDGAKIWDWISELLCIFDYFQSWSRENKYQGLYDGSCIEKTILREVQVQNAHFGQRARLMLRIDYLPYHFISPKDTAIANAEKRLKNILRGHFDHLKIMNVNRLDEELLWRDIILDFKFMIAGRSITL